MGFTDQLKKTLKAAAAQLTYSSNKPVIRLTKKCADQARQLGLTAADARDVYYHGTVSLANKNKIEKTYSGYSISIFYFHDSRTGEPVISSIRKWEKR